MTIDNVQLLEDKFKKWVLFHNLATLSTDLSALEGVDELGQVRLNDEFGLIFHLRMRLLLKQILFPKVSKKISRYGLFQNFAASRIESIDDELG